MQDNAKEHAYTQAAVILFGFGFLCLLTAGILGFDVSEHEAALTGTRQDVPISTETDNTVFEVEIEQQLSDNSWAHVSGEILDADGRYLFSFGDELWRESGYDADGYWSERETEYEMDFTLRDEGDYILRIQREFPPGVAPARGRVSIERNIGSSLPFILIGALSLIVGTLLGRRSMENIWEAFTR